MYQMMSKYNILLVGLLNAHSKKLIIDGPNPLTSTEPFSRSTATLGETDISRKDLHPGVKPFSDPRPYGHLT